MRFAVIFISLISTFQCWAQEDFLAKQYFNDGEFEKAAVFYENLTEKNPRRTDYAEGLIACYQQLEKYEEAQTFLLKKIESGNPYPTIYIELGYNYLLQGQTEMAKENYEIALSIIESKI